MRAHRRQPPTFVDVIQDLAEAAGERPAYTFLEVGPAPALVRLGLEWLAGADLLWVASLRRREPWRARSSRRRRAPRPGPHARPRNPL